MKIIAPFMQGMLTFLYFAIRGCCWKHTRLLRNPWEKSKFFRRYKVVNKDETWIRNPHNCFSTSIFFRINCLVIFTIFAASVPSRHFQVIFIWGNLLGIQKRSISLNFIIFIPIHITSGIFPIEFQIKQLLFVSYKSTLPIYRAGVTIWFRYWTHDISHPNEI